MVSLYKSVFDQFSQAYPDFGGAKIIFAPLRRVDNATMDSFIALVSQLRVSPSLQSLFPFVGTSFLDTTIPKAQSSMHCVWEWPECDNPEPIAVDPWSMYGMECRQFCSFYCPGIDFDLPTLSTDRGY